MSKPTYRRLPFRKALDWLKAKLPIPTERWDTLVDGAQDWAFTIAGVTHGQLLQEALDLVTKAVDDGQLYRDFKQQFAETFIKRGFSPLNDWRMRLILLQNMRNAYGAGRYQQQHDPETVLRRPYLVYRHDDPITPRPHHVALDGFVARADDPIWNTLHPPNGFGCRCRTFSLNERQLRQEGMSLSDPLPTMAVKDKRTGQQFTAPVVKVGDKTVPVIEPGFNFAPGSTQDRARAIQDTVSRMHPGLRERVMGMLRRREG